MSKASVMVCTFVAIERQGWVTPLMAKFFMDCSAADARGERRIAVDMVADKLPHDIARNCGVKRFLESDHEWLLMIDNDQSFDVASLDMLDSAPSEAAVVVPRFCTAKMEGNPARPHLTMVWDCPINPKKGDAWVEIKHCGTGCMAIRRSTFAKLGRSCGRDADLRQLAN